MSSIVTFFRAPDHTAALATAAVHGSTPWPGGLHYGNFDADEALLSWEHLLTGRDFAAVLADEHPEDVLPRDDEDGPLLLAISPTLHTRLATAEPALLSTTAARWTSELTADGIEFDLRLAAEMLTSLSHLARSGPTTDRLYCLLA
ncbi:hypothetical protein [Kitasatospora cineracea]|uniref:hypothetical protein n=1 Tax=Kitasatospora cineracea TaxID=88074 RepID=UPI00368C5EFE